MGENECLVLNIRSSMGGKFTLSTIQGWIDCDYFDNESNDGNIGVFLKNISDKPILISKGERIAQGAFFNFLVSDNGNTDDDRVGGWGSSGKQVQNMSKEIVSDLEWQEWIEFLDEYNTKKKEKQEKSLLYWIYKRLKGENNNE